MSCCWFRWKAIDFATLSHDSVLFYKGDDKPEKVVSRWTRARKRVSKVNVIFFYHYQKNKKNYLSSNIDSDGWNNDFISSLLRVYLKTKRRRN